MKDIYLTCLHSHPDDVDAPSATYAAFIKLDDVEAEKAVDTFNTKGTIDMHPLLEQNKAANCDEEKTIYNFTTDGFKKHDDGYIQHLSNKTKTIYSLEVEEATAEKEYVKIEKIQFSFL